MKNFTFPQIVFYFGIISLLVSCQDEVILPRDHPRIEISSEIIQSEAGISFEATIISEGISEITDKGFVWDVFTPTINHSRLSLGSHQGTGSFTGMASTGFIKGREYRVRAYLITEEYTVYSHILEFKSDFNFPE